MNLAPSDLSEIASHCPLLSVTVRYCPLLRQVNLAPSDLSEIASHGEGGRLFADAYRTYQARICMHT